MVNWMRPWAQILVPWEGSCFCAAKDLVVSMPEFVYTHFQGFVGIRVSVEQINMARGLSH